jgi:hypothetical protein
MTEQEKNKQPEKNNTAGANKQTQNGKANKCQFPKAENSEAAVPILCYGASNNYDTFKKKMLLACMEKYKNLGR